LLLVEGLADMVPVDVPLADPEQFCDFMAGSVVLLVEFDPLAPFAPLTEPVVFVSGVIAPSFEPVPLPMPVPVPVPLPVPFEPLLIPPAAPPLAPPAEPAPALCAIADVAIPTVRAATAIIFNIGFSFLGRLFFRSE
jgi:hypothetical protein